MKIFREACSVAVALADEGVSAKDIAEALNEKIGPHFYAKGGSVLKIRPIQSDRTEDLVVIDLNK